MQIGSVLYFIHFVLFKPVFFLIEVKMDMSHYWGMHLFK